MLRSTARRWSTLVMRPVRADFKYFLPIQTRWGDNDQYGHVNNVVYYSYSDTAINHFLINHAGFDREAKHIGVCVASSFKYITPVSYPELISVGVNVQKLGISSVVYHVGVFSGEKHTPSALGDFVQVFVDRHTYKKVPIPLHLLPHLKAIHGS